MAVHGSTKKELRQAIGDALGRMRTGTATGGSTTTLVDPSLPGGNPRQSVEQE